MSQLGKYFLSPTERKRYSIDYSDWLDQAELVADPVTFEVTPSTGNPVVVDGYSLNPNGTSIVFYATGGDPGAFKVSVNMATTGGQVRVDTVQYTVKAQ